MSDEGGELSHDWIGVEKDLRRPRAWFVVSEDHVH